MPDLVMSAAQALECGFGVRQLAAAFLRRKLASGSGSSKRETQKVTTLVAVTKAWISAVCAGIGL